MSHCLEEVKEYIKLARNQAVTQNQYSESLQNYVLAKQIVDKQIIAIADKSLLQEWKRLKAQVDDEYAITVQLENAIKGILPTPQKKNFFNECPDFQYNQKHQAEEKRYPFGKVPFSHHAINQMEENYQQHMNQQQPQNQQNDFEPQLNRQSSLQQQNYGYPNNNTNRNSNGNSNQNIFQPYQNQRKEENNDNIFLENKNYNRANSNEQFDEYQPFYPKQQNVPNQNQQQPYKDPAVWDLPLTKPMPQKGTKKKSTTKSPYNQQPSQGKQTNDRRSNYEKPWQVNTVLDKQVANKIDKNNEEKENEQDFLHHCYPDGQGPDADLIRMLERDVVDKNPNVVFDDIAELDKAKDILQEAVLLPILIPNYFTGIRRPWKGVLLFGPPGTGKTMLAKAVATTGKTTFFNVSASSLASKWRGDSEKLVRILFEMARFYTPSTVFIDEVDSIGSKRVSDDNDANRRMKAEMLIQMDGIVGSNTSVENTKERKLVMVLAATNRPQDLDEALRRRLEKRILIPLPSKAGRQALFKLNMKSIKCDESINWDDLVNKTEGYSGADITNLCREAALMPMRRKLVKEGGFKNINNIQNLQDECDIPLTQQDFEQALKNINKSVSQDDLAGYEKWMTEFGAV